MTAADLDNTRHGQTRDEFPLPVFLSDDPELALVHADMGAWMDAHPCDCEALCECDTTEDAP